MPYSRPTLDELQAQGAADLEAALPGSDPLLPFSVLGILITVLMGAIYLLYGYLDWIALQAVPFTATDEALEGWAALRGVTREAPTYATGSLPVPASDGTVIPGNFPVTRNDGTAYLTTAPSAPASGGVANCPVQAVVAGAAGNTAIGVQFTLGQNYAGVTASTFVSTTALSGGADAESDDSLRSRMNQAYANPPQGGAQGDYVTWALQVAGVTRAWVSVEGMGPGTALVWFMMDVLEAAHAGFPQGTNGVAASEARVTTHAAGDQLLVANHIYPLQPVTALVYASAPLPNSIDLTIYQGGGTWSSDTRNAVNAAIDAVYLAYGSPLQSSLDVEWLNTAIAAVPGTTGFVITAITCTNGTISPGVNGNIVSSLGYLPQRRTTTWA